MNHRGNPWQSLRTLAAIGLLAAGSGCNRHPLPPPPAPLDLTEAPAAVGPCGPPEASQAQLEPRRVALDSGLPLGLATAEVPAAAAAQASVWERPELLLEIQIARRAAAKNTPTAALAVAAMRPWEIQFFKGNTMEMYTRQLEFFGFELGVILPDNKIMYIPHPTKPKTDLRTGPADLETRAYLSWSRGDLIEADRNVARQAGIEVENRVMVCFVPLQVEKTLAELEQKHAGEKLSQVAKTRFGVRRKGDDYEWHVLEQSYQTTPGGSR